MTPSLSLIAMVVNARTGITLNELRFGMGETARAAQAAYAWLADQLTDTGHGAIALWLGAADDIVRDLIAEAEARRADEAFAERLDDIALEVLAEHLTRDRLGKLRPERSPFETAIHLLGRNALVSLDEMRALAAGFLSLQANLDTQRAAPAPEQAVPAAPASSFEAAVRAVVMAHQRFQGALFSRHERGARADLERAFAELSKQPEFSKETING